MDSLFGDPAPKRVRLSEQDHPEVIERGRGVVFHLQGVKFDDDNILAEANEVPAYRSPPFLSLDVKTVFTVQSFRSTVDRTLHHFIVRYSLADGQARYCRCFTEDQPQGSYFRIAEFGDRHRFSYAYFYALSNDRLGALAVDTDTSRAIVNQYVIRIEHQSRLAEVIAHRSLPMGGPRSLNFKISLQLDDRIMVSNKLDPLLILAADIEAPESNKYCHCCRLDGYFSRLISEAWNHNVSQPFFETLTLGRNGVYVGTLPFGVLGLEWQRNSELPADLCHRRAEDTVPVFYRFDQQFVSICDNYYWIQEVASNGLAAFICQHMPLHDRNQPGLERITLNVFVMDLARLVPAHKSFWDGRLNLVPGTSSVVVQFDYPKNLLRLRSAFDVPPLRQLAFEAVYKHMKPEERSKSDWMQTLCGFECV